MARQDRLVLLHRFPGTGTGFIKLPHQGPGPLRMADKPQPFPVRGGFEKTVRAVRGGEERRAVGQLARCPGQGGILSGPPS